MADDGDARYRPLFLTWHLLQAATRAAPPPPAATATAAAAASPAEPPLRQRVQAARIERRWTVAELARARRRGDPRVFERGDEVLASDCGGGTAALDLG